MTPQGGIPTVQIFLKDIEEWAFKASPTCLDTPEFMPSVIIHAPVVSAALTRPWLKVSLILEDILKFWRPPWTEITSFGSSIFHSFNIKCNR